MSCDLSISNRNCCARNFAVEHANRMRRTQAPDYVYRATANGTNRTAPVQATAEAKRRHSVVVLLGHSDVGSIQ